MYGVHGFMMGCGFTATTSPRSYSANSASLSARKPYGWSEDRALNKGTVGVSGAEGLPSAKRCPWNAGCWAAKVQQGSPKTSCGHIYYVLATGWPLAAALHLKTQPTGASSRRGRTPSALR